MNGHALRPGTKALVVAVAALAALGLFVAQVMAHPLGNFTINRYARLELYRGAVHLHYVVDYAEIPTFQALSDIDRDGDGLASPTELDAYGHRAAASWRDAMTLNVDGQAAPLTLSDVHATFVPGQGGLDTLRIAVLYIAPLPVEGPRAVLSYEDRNFSDRIGWKEIVVQAGSVNAAFDARFAIDRTQGLAVYPAESLESAPDDRRLSLVFEPGTGSTAPGELTAPVASEGARTSGCSFSIGGAESCLARLITEDVTLASLLFSLVAAFGFGMLHALGPGHGKTVVAAYLVGSRGKVRHALALGGTVTLTHTAAVYILGFVALVASEEFATEKVQLWLGVASGLLIIAWGAGLFAVRLRAILRNDAHPGEDGMHRHGLFGRKHSHMALGSRLSALGEGVAGGASLGAPSQSHAHDHHGHAALGSRLSALGEGVAGGAPLGAPLQSHAHDHHGHDHDHGHHDVGHYGHDHGQHGHAHSQYAAHATESREPRAESRPGHVTWRSTFTLGVIGGMLPCPSAVVVMLAAISLGRIAYGMLLIVAFSAGLAGVLMAIGVALVLGQRFGRDSKAARVFSRPQFAFLARAVPVAGAFAVFLAGIGVTTIAINRPGL